MKKLTFEYHQQNIRHTPKGQPSIFDMIKVLGGKKNPRDAWNRLCDWHPEVVAKTDNFKFPGRGQRPTPVAKDKNAAMYILSLLPGVAGKSLRQDAIDLYEAFIDRPEDVAKAAINRIEDEQKLEGVKQQAKVRGNYLATHHGVKQIGQDHYGWKERHFAQWNRNNNDLLNIPSGFRKSMSEAKTLEFTMVQAFQQLRLKQEAEENPLMTVELPWAGIGIASEAGSQVKKLIESTTGLAVR